MQKGKCAVGTGIILFCLVLMILGAGCINNEKQPTLEEAYEDQLHAAENLATDVTEDMQKAIRSFLRATQNIAVEPANHTLVNQEFTDLYLQYESLRSLLVVDEHNVITSIHPNYSVHLNVQVGDVITDPDFVYSVDSPAFTVVHYTTSGNSSVAGFVAPMVSDEGAYKGVIIATIDSRLFYETLVYNFQEQTGYKAWVLDDTGNILYYPDRYAATISITQLKSPDQVQLDRVLQSILTNTSGVDIYTIYI